MPDGDPRVEVLLSTYDGERYVDAQIESILAQDYAPLLLTVRDDGSRDGTRERLRRYTADPRVRLLEPGRAGLPDAYFALLDDADPSSELVALADQDDVWRPDKISRAVAHLRDRPGPAMYCSRVELVSADLQPLGLHPLPRRGPSFGNALVQNVATGCTIVLNRPALSLVRGRWPAYAVMHDAWLYLVLSGTGEVVYDPFPTVLYRQHDRNSVGVGRSAVARVHGRLRRQLQPGGAGAHGRQNVSLLATHGDLLLPPHRAALEDFLQSRSSLRARLRYALRGAAHRQTPGSDLVLKGLNVLDRV